jgi:hypothetical protein
VAKGDEAVEGVEESSARDREGRARREAASAADKYLFIGVNRSL